MIDKMMKAFKFMMALSIFALPFTLKAQDDDIYFVPRKAAKQTSETRYVPVEIIYDDDNDMPSTQGSTRNVDEYNRRNRGSMTYQLPGNDTVYVMDEAPTSTSRSAYEQGFSDGEDYAYSRRLSRFGYSSIYVSPWYWSYYHDPFYWNDWYWGAYDPYWYGWHGYGWGRPYWSAYWGWNHGWYGGYSWGWHRPYHYTSWRPRSTSAFRNAGYLGRGNRYTGNTRGRGYTNSRTSGTGRSSGTYSGNTRSRSGYTGNTRGSGQVGTTHRSTAVSVPSQRSSGYSGSTRSGGFSGSGGYSGGSRSGGFSGSSTRGGGGRGR